MACLIKRKKKAIKRTIELDFMRLQKKLWNIKTYFSIIDKITINGKF